VKSAALLAVVLVPVWGQAAKPVAATLPTVAPAPKPAIPRSVLRDLESRFDNSIVTAAADPIDLRGFTRGLYLEGYGVVFTAEIDLIRSPTPNPFRLVIPPAEVVRTHQRKVEHIPVLVQTMKEMMALSANTLTALRPTDQIVLQVRILYQAWEDTKGLPPEIRMKADRKSAVAGEIQVDEQ
jgi:hypothetical protein